MGKEVRQAGFLTELEVKNLSDKEWELTSDLVYYSRILRYEIRVPKGRKTDFASVPRVPVAYWFWGGRCHKESALHDYLYQTGKVNKQLADRIFLEAMKSRKKNMIIRDPMYWGVVLGGGKAWRGHRDND